YIQPNTILSLYSQYSSPPQLHTLSLHDALPIYPSRSTVADFAPRSSRALSAAVARVFALSSVSLPMSRNTVIAAAASNHTWYSAGTDQPQPSSTARPRVT